MIEAINTFPLRPEALTSLRQNAGADQGARIPARSAQPRLNAQLQQAMQAGRESSALLSTLPGPNLSFFHAPAPLELTPRQPAFAATGASPGGFQPAGSRGRLNVPLLEAMQTGRETSALLSPLMGPNVRAFPAPAPLGFAPRREAVAAPGTGAQAAAGNMLPRAGAQLLETEQAGRTTSTLLSGLMAPGQAGGLSGVSPFARPTVGTVSGDPLATMRTAQEIMQTVGTAPPSAENRRIASEAYLMEARAQRDYENQRTAGRTGTGEWFA